MVDAGGVQVLRARLLLLPRMPSRRCSFCINYIIGVGILAVPYAFTQAGPLLASLYAPSPFTPDSQPCHVTSLSVS